MREEGKQQQPEILCGAKYAAWEEEILYLKKRERERTTADKCRLENYSLDSFLFIANTELQRKVIHLCYLS